MSKSINIVSSDGKHHRLTNIVRVSAEQGRIILWRERDQLPNEACGYGKPQEIHAVFDTVISLVEEDYFNDL